MIFAVHSHCLYTLYTPAEEWHGSARLNTLTSHHHQSGGWLQLLCRSHPLLNSSAFFFPSLPLTTRRLVSRPVISIYRFDGPLAALVVSFRVNIDNQWTRLMCTTSRLTGKSVAKKKKVLLFVLDFLITHWITGRIFINISNYDRKQTPCGTPLEYGFRFN